MSAQLAVPGDVIAHQVGRVVIRLQYVRDNAYTVTVEQGTLRIDDNCGSYTTEAEARAIARGYAQMHRAEQITAVETELRHAISEGADCTDLHSRLAALRNQPIDEAVREAAANGGTLTAGIDVTDAELRVLVARRLVAATRSWADGGKVVGGELTLLGWRRAETLPPARTVADTVPAGTHRQVRPTMAGAHLAAPSDPAQRVLRAAHANGGTIARSKAATVVQLQSLARKGLVTLNYATGTGRRRVVESATLTDRGRKAVA